MVNALTAALQSVGAKVTWLRQGGGRSWHVIVETPPEVRHRFALAPELHLVVTDRFQVRDLDAAWEVKSELRGRVDLDLVVVCSQDPDLQDRVACLGLPSGRQVACWPMPDRGVMPPLADALARSLPYHDPFDVRDAVRGLAVRGRSDEIAGLLRAVQAGRMTAVVGLRKVGKTTLVRAVADLLQQDSDFRVAWADGERALGNTDRVAAAWVKELGGGDGPALDRLEAAIQGPIDQGQRVCLVLDEFDTVLDSNSCPGQPSTLDLFRLLRGVAQTTGRLSLVLVGRDPTLLTGPRLRGQPNPFLAWASHQWVGPLKRPDADRLLTELGRRCALEVGPASLERAFTWTGGHPLLQRQFGSSLLRAAQQNQSSDLSFRSDPVLDRAESEFLRRQHVRDVVTEILGLLRERYPIALERLADVVKDPASVIVGQALENDPAWEVLVHFGLLGPNPDRPRPCRLLVEAAWRDLLPLRKAG